MSEQKWCVYCGRGGTRWFVLDYSLGRYACKSERACERRRRAWRRGWRFARRRA